MKKPSFKTDVNKFAAKIRNINNDFILNAKKEVFFLKDRFNKSILKLKQKNNKTLEIRKITNLKKLEGRDNFNNIFDKNKTSFKTDVKKFTSKLRNNNNNFISNTKKDIVMTGLIKICLNDLATLFRAPSQVQDCGATE